MPSLRDEAQLGVAFGAPGSLVPESRSLGPATERSV
jgi:hypothetical protein